MDRRTFAVAAFEFRRFFDPRGELVALAVLALVALLKFGGEALLLVAAGEPARVAVSTPHGDALPAAAADARFRFVAVAPRDVDAAVRDVHAGRLAALVEHGDGQRYVLHAGDGMRRRDALAEAFAPVHVALQARRLGIDPRAATAMAAPPVFDVVDAGGNGRDDTAGVAIALGVMVLTTLAMLASIALVLQGITAEKTGRVAEMVLAAVPPAVWIDGKVLAANLHAMKTLVGYGLYGVAAAVVLGLLDAARLHAIATAWPLVLLALGIGMAGLVFWTLVFAFTAALLPSAASPVRNTLPLLPMTCLALCLGGVRDPGNPVFAVFALLPPTMPFALPIRVVSGAAGTGEVLAAIAITAVAAAGLRAWLLRRFATDMLGLGARPAAGRGTAGA